MTVASTIARVPVILLALAGMAGQLAYLDALWWHTLGLAHPVARNVSGPTILLLSAHAVVAVVCSLLAITLVLHERRRPSAARALGTAFASWSYLMAYSGVTMLFRPVAPGPAREVFEAHFLVVEMIGLAALVRFTSTFPRRLGVDELEPLPTLPAVLRPFHTASVAMRRPAAPWLAALIVLASAWGWAVAFGDTIGDAALSPLMDAVRFFAVGLVVMYLRRAWSAATEGDRDGLLWLLASLAFLLGSLSLLIGGNVLVAVTGFPEPGVAWRPILLDVGVIGFFVLMARSVLRSGASDPMHVTRTIARTTAVATAGLFLAAGLEALFAGGLLGPYSVRGGVGTAVAFAIILSAHRALGRLVDRALPT
jgi:hypothetical protein